MHNSIKKFYLVFILFVLSLPVRVFAWENPFYTNKNPLYKYTFGSESFFAAKIAEAGSDTALGVIKILVSVVNSLILYFVALGATFSELALNLSFEIASSPAVQQGFKIVLTLANLGFVIAIVVIALATIFRNQTYGIKKALIRLVVMAILVNFSLILTGMLINFSDQLTMYFVKATSPDVLGNEGGTGAITFSQKLIQGINVPALQKTDSGGLATVVDNSIAELIGAITTITFTALTALAMWVLAVTLFVRYTILSLLLIIMPVAWLGWIFPGTSGWWKKWWDKFISWTLYAPAMMFFVYLAMTLATSKMYFPTDKGAAIIAGSSVNIAVKQLVVVFLMFGGFFAAKSMGIGMAGAAANLATNVGKKMGKATGRAAWRGSKRAGGAMFGETLKKYGEKWQRAGANSNPFLRTLAAPVRELGAQLTRGKEGLTSGTFKQYQEKYKDMSEAERVNRVAASRGIEQIALLESLKDSKRFGEAVAKAAPNLANEDAFKRWGQGELYKTARNKSGLAFHQYAQSRTMAKTPADHDAIDADLAKTIKETGAENFVNFFKPYDPKTPPLGMTQSQYEQAQAEIVKGLAYYGSTEKIRKVFTDESFDKDRAELFKDAGTRAGITEAQIQTNNPKFYNWAKVGKGKGMVDVSDFI